MKLTLFVVTVGSIVVFLLYQAEEISSKEAVIGIGVLAAVCLFTMIVSNFFSGVTIATEDDTDEDEWIQNSLTVRQNGLERRLEERIQRLEENINERFIYLAKQPIRIAEQTVTLEEIVSEVVEKSSPKLRDYVLEALSDYDLDDLLNDDDIEELVNRIAQVVEKDALAKVTKEDLVSALTDKILEDELLDLGEIERTVSKKIFDSATLSLNKE